MPVPLFASSLDAYQDQIAERLSEIARVDPDTYCCTREAVQNAVTERTTAIVPVHLFGNVAPVPELRDLGLPLLEDAAQAAGASLGGTKAGALGDAATFSFFPSKNLGCLGDGGAIVTNDEAVAAPARGLRFPRSGGKVPYTGVGYNSRPHALPAGGGGRPPPRPPRQ